MVELLEPCKKFMWHTHLALHSKPWIYVRVELVEAFSI